MEEGEEDEEEVTKYVHTFLDEEDEITSQRKQMYLAPIIKRQASRHQAPRHQASRYSCTYTAIAWEEEEVTTYVHFRGRAQGCGSVQEHRTKHFSITYIHT